MVYLVEDWKIMEQYGTEPQTVYQILAAEEEKTVIRVAAGRIGFRKEFDDPKDPLISHIIKFCKSESYVKLANTIEADHFFK
ncbi:MAG: hypothetical protein D4S01_10010 [Dehalococcoidia bacterium]|nr:MAG: hypothetical protein D4S01_10010 [Dehalococcoidia bacterium]